MTLNPLENPRLHGAIRAANRVLAVVAVVFLTTGFALHVGNVWFGDGHGFTPASVFLFLAGSIFFLLVNYVRLVTRGPFTLNSSTGFWSYQSRLQRSWGAAALGGILSVGAGLANFLLGWTGLALWLLFGALMALGYAFHVRNFLSDQIPTSAQMPVSPAAGGIGDEDTGDQVAYEPDLAHGRPNPKIQPGLSADWQPPVGRAPAQYPSRPPQGRPGPGQQSPPWTGPRPDQTDDQRRTPGRNRGRH